MKKSTLMLALVASILAGSSQQAQAQSRALLTDRKEDIRDRREDRRDRREDVRDRKEDIRDRRANRRDRKF